MQAWLIRREPNLETRQLLSDTDEKQRNHFIWKACKSETPQRLALFFHLSLVLPHVLKLSSSSSLPPLSCSFYLMNRFSSSCLQDRDKNVLTWKRRWHRESRICSKRDSFDSEVELTCDVLSQRSSPLKIRWLETLLVSLNTKGEEYTVLSL